jgi:hypothetical protein
LIYAEGLIDEVEVSVEDDDDDDEEEEEEELFGDT